MGLIFLYLSVALAISFLCSLLEAILLSTPLSFITMKESHGVQGAALLKEHKHNIDRPISAILSLNTVAHTIGAAGVGAEAVKLFGDEHFGVISAILTILILVLSEIIPKTIGATYWRELCIPAAKVIRWMIIVCYPLVRLSELLTDAIDNNRGSVRMSREEVMSTIDAGIKDGIISREDIIEKLNDTEVSQASAEVQSPPTRWRGARARRETKFLKHQPGCNLGPPEA